MTRVKAILRRGRTGPAAAQSVMAHVDLLLNREKRKLSVAGRQVFLTPNEYALLEALMARPGKTFTRDELLERLYPKGEAHVIDRVIDVHVGKLRQKIEKDLGNPGFDCPCGAAVFCTGQTGAGAPAADDRHDPQDRCG
jgi:DNA-binding response OmpR family regulator